MKKIYLNLILAFLCLSANAQLKEPISPYGIVPKADIELSKCDFEPDADAEVLFDVSRVYYAGFNRTEERHRRVKIFDDRAKDIANVEIPYFNADMMSFIDNMEAQTINFVDGKPQITKVEKSQVYKKKIDGDNTALVFAFPNVKKGSIIEYKYKIADQMTFTSDYWIFQAMIPVRYSRIGITVPTDLMYRPIPHITQPMISLPKLEKGHLSAEESVWAMQNVHSMKKEPFMTSFKDNTQHMVFMLDAMNFGRFFWQLSPSSWPKVSEMLLANEHFGAALGRKLPGEETILDSVKLFKSDEQKIAYLFNTVKKQMSNKMGGSILMEKTIVEPWRLKGGTITEINLILYHLLKKAKITAYPLLVNKRSVSKVDPSVVNLGQFSHTLVYVPLENEAFYVLDTSDKYNQYNAIPQNVLNSLGFLIDEDAPKSKMVFLEAPLPANRSILVNGEISLKGYCDGKAQLGLYSYPRLASINKYKTDGEKKFIESLRISNNDLEVKSLSFENLEVDTLPLMEKIEFRQPLDGNDNYIYINPNLFLQFGENPFISEDRFTDIDLSYRNNLLYTGQFKLPEGYAVETLPQNIVLKMPDQSISFKRMVAVNGNALTVQYMLSFQKSYFFKENYPDIREFYRKMYEAVNTQIALKKS